MFLSSSVDCFKINVLVRVFLFWKRWTCLPRIDTTDNGRLSEGLRLQKNGHWLPVKNSASNKTAIWRKHFFRIWCFFSCNCFISSSDCLDIYPSNRASSFVSDHSSARTFDVQYQCALVQVTSSSINAQLIKKCCLIRSKFRVSAIYSCRKIAFYKIGFLMMTMNDIFFVLSLPSKTLFLDRFYFQVFEKTSERQAPQLK